MSKKNVFLEAMFDRIFFDLASKNGAKIDNFSFFFRQRRFCKNHAPVEAGARFLGFGASKNRTKIDAKTYSKITSKKKAQKSNFGIHFGVPKPLKSLRKAMLNEACFATLWNLRGSRRKVTGVATFGLRKWLCI